MGKLTAENEQVPAALHSTIKQYSAQTGNQLANNNQIDIATDLRKLTQNCNTSASCSLALLLPILVSAEPVILINAPLNTWSTTNPECGSSCKRQLPIKFTTNLTLYFQLIEEIYSTVLRGKLLSSLCKTSKCLLIVQCFHILQFCFLLQATIYICNHMQSLLTKPMLYIYCI